MATAAVQQAPGNSTFERVEPLVAESNKPKKHNVATQLYYYKDPGDGTAPSPAYVGKPETYDRPFISQDVLIHDISGEEENYTLDSHGFQILRHESSEKAFIDDDKIKAEYYPETEQLLKDATGASKVYIFDHTIRRQSNDRRDPEAPIQLRGPVRRVHIDQSYDASIQRVSHHLPSEANELLKKRFQIINVWRPIKKIQKDPLAVADAHSVPESDLLPAALVYPDRRGETFVVKPSAAHKWYFKYGQLPSEVLLIKCFDSDGHSANRSGSDKDGLARRVPHSAFTDPAEEDKEARESIEVRALVFY